MKLLKHTIPLLLSLILILTLAAPVTAQDVSLTVTGDGVEREMVITLAELKGMTANMSRNAYSAWNTFPSQRTYYAEGVSLAALLELAGIKEGATTINIATSPEADGSPGYNQTFLLKDILAERYTFGNGKTAVPAIIAVKLSESGFDKMDEVDMRLIHGQLADQEQTSAGFVQSVRSITVTCAPVQRLPQPKAQAALLPDGQYSVSLGSDYVNAKVYYTKDGSEPTVGSTMYNISAAHWQPQLNVPFNAGGDARIRAIAVASGFENSAVYSFTPQSLGGGVTFADVPAGFWAADAINALSEKGIVSGMGGGVFAPQGTLTRAQFSKMIVLGVNGEEPPAATTVKFSDVAVGAWYAPYVEEGVKLGLFTGYEDGSFRPNDPVTREQMLAVAVRALQGGDGEISADSSAFAAEGISTWAKRYIEYAYSNGFVAKEMTGEKDGLLYFDGRKDGIRAEAAYVVFKINSNR